MSYSWSSKVHLAIVSLSFLCFCLVGFHLIYKCSLFWSIYSAVLEDLLSPFCIFDKEGYHPGSSPDTNQYISTVWTDKKMCIPSMIIVYASPPCCRTTPDSVEGKVVPLSVMTAFNTGDGLEAQD